MWGRKVCLLLIENVKESLLMKNEGVRPVDSPGKSGPGKYNRECEGSEAEVCLDHSETSKEGSVGLAEC